MLSTDVRSVLIESLTIRTNSRAEIECSRISSKATNTEQGSDKDNIHTDSPDELQLLERKCCLSTDK